MDPFNDKLEDEDDHEEESAVDRSFSSRHSNGNDDAGFDRVSLPSVRHAQKGSINHVHAKDIEFELENEEKQNEDLEVNDRHENSKNLSDAGTDDQLGKSKKRGGGFGEGIDSDDDEDPSGK